MQTIKVMNNQSLLDIAIQTTGKMSNFFWIAKENDIVPSNPLPVGTLLVIPEGIERDLEMVAFYARKGIVPATELDAQQQVEVDLTCEEKLYNCFKY